MTKDLAIRSPFSKVGGLFFLGRTLDKIKLHASGGLPAEYQPNLGKGFDDRVTKLLGVDYADLVARVKQGGERRRNFAVVLRQRPQTFRRRGFHLE